MKYPYKKNFFYYLAYGIKMFKKIPLVIKIKEFKENLRDKGWKI